MSSHLSDPACGVAVPDIPIAQISTISLARLHKKDPAEIALLERVCSNAGFFYLDFRGDTEGDRVVTHLADVDAVVEKYFDQPDEAKAKDIRLDIKASQDLGYKRGRGGESFEVSTPNLILRQIVNHHVDSANPMGTRFHGMKWHQTAHQKCRSFSSMIGPRSATSSLAVTRLA